MKGSPQVDWTVGSRFASAAAMASSFSDSHASACAAFFGEPVTVVGQRAHGIRRTGAASSAMAPGATAAALDEFDELGRILDLLLGAPASAPDTCRRHPRRAATLLVLVAAGPGAAVVVGTAVGDVITDGWSAPVTQRSSGCPGGCGLALSCEHPTGTAAAAINTAARFISTSHAPASGDWIVVPRYDSEMILVVGGPLSPRADDDPAHRHGQLAEFRRPDSAKAANRFCMGVSPFAHDQRRGLLLRCDERAVQVT